MSTPIISVENLSKSYLVGHRAPRGEMHNYTALRDVIGREVRNAARKAVDMVRGRQVVQGDSVEEFWALRDVSFEVQEGEVLGIIGRNGAGKSTLLKILSRITEPTRGRVTLRGRVASLLEVGTGFHPELTGRENIYLNGAILGMSRAEIRRKFDEIVAFAEVERFLDTPVKRYSSGMYVRLAFAVAAHLEPEILIVDEVLAVGDAEFQKKCLGKMDEVSRREGRTVLFVSHNMAAVTQLTTRALLFDGGAIALDGVPSEVIASYSRTRHRQTVYVSPHVEQYEQPHVARAEVITSGASGVHNCGEALVVNVWVRHRKPLARGHLGIQLIDWMEDATAAVHAYPPDAIFGREPGVTLIRFNIPKLRVNIGQFHLRIWLTGPPGDEIHEVVDACDFEVTRDAAARLSWWRQENCTYLEDFTVDLLPNSGTPDRSDRDTHLVPSVAFVS